jgi:hypothetical protein
VSTRAKLLIDDMPDLGLGAKRYQVDCRWSTSTAWLIPGPLDLPSELIVMQVVMKHQDECGQCDLSDVWRQTDPQMRAELERLTQAAAAYAIRAEGRTN